MLLLLNSALLPMLFFIGLVTSYEDIRQGRIRNKWILLGLGWGLGIFSLLIIWYFIAAPVSEFYYFKILARPLDSPAPVYTFNLAFLQASLLNFFSALIVGFLLWRFNSWAAGDAKLFLVYSLLIPIFHYQPVAWPIFPSFALLINIFSVFLIYLCFSIVFYFSRLFYQRLVSLLAETSGFLPGWRLKKVVWSVDRPAAAKKIKQFLSGLVLPLFIVLAIGFGQPWAEKYLAWNLLAWQPFIFATLIIFSQIMSAVTARRWLVVVLGAASAAIGLCGLAVDPAGAALKIYGALKSMIVFTVLFGLFQGLMNFYFRNNYSRRINLAELAPGMMIDPSVWRRLNLAEGASSKFRELDGRQVEKIRESFSKAGETTVEIFKSSFFAPWVFVGAIATLIFKAPLINVLSGWLNL